jgi:hypothetical protein
MGFDITAYATDEETDDFDLVEEVAYHRAYMGGFRMMREQGYDWFELIDAYDCYGGVSGNGTAKLIKLALLKNALKVLMEHKPTNLANNGLPDGDLRDEFSDRKPILKEFMEKCIEFCEKNEKGEILIYFG